MRLLVVLAALSLVACAGNPPPEPATALPVLPAASLYDPISIPAATFDHPLAAAQYFARYNPAGEGAATLDLLSQNHAGPDSLVMIFMVDGYADDSVQGEQWRIELDRVTSGWRVTSAGRRVKCYRGANAGSWQRGLCP